MDHWNVNRITRKNITEWIGFIFDILQSNSSVLKNILWYVLFCSLNTINTVQKYYEIFGNSKVEEQSTQNTIGHQGYFFYLITNFKAFDAPLNIVRFHPNFFWWVFIINGTKWEGENKEILKKKFPIGLRTNLMNNIEVMLRIFNLPLPDQECIIFLHSLPTSWINVEYNAATLEFSRIIYIVFENKFGIYLSPVASMTWKYWSDSMRTARNELNVLLVLMIRERIFRRFSLLWSTSLSAVYSSTDKTPLDISRSNHDLSGFVRSKNLRTSSSILPWFETSPTW